MERTALENLEKLENLENSIFKKVGKRILTKKEVADYLVVDVDTVTSIVDGGSLSPISSTVQQFTIHAIACFEMDISREIPQNNATAIAQSAYAALQYLTSEENEEDIALANQNNVGSVYFAQHRKCYQAAFYITLPSGGKKRKIVSDPTEQGARDKMRVAMALAEQQFTNNGNAPVIILNAPQEPPKTIRTFGDVTAECLRLAKTNNSDVTYGDKVSQINRHILPVFGNKNIAEIDNISVKDFLEQIVSSRDGKKPSQALINNVYKNFKWIMNFAVHRKYIDQVPTYGVKKPTGICTNKESKVFNNEQLIDILHCVLENEKYLAITLTALATGMRSQEFLALKWGNIDFEKKTISVTCAMIRVLNKDPDSTIKWTREIGETKTKSSNRVIYVGDTVLNALKVWKKYLIETGIVDLASKKNNEDFVFLDRNGEPQQYDHVSSNYKKFLNRHGLGEYDVTFHKFRHCFASIAASNGVDHTALKAFMGHSNNDITSDIYTTLSDEFLRRNADIIEKAISEIWEKAQQKNSKTE
ncbi:MAG: tyrosine-type recombinase/integrase [Oscillospiraceae bacterium]